jgi:hypothetical protein
MGGAPPTRRRTSPARVQAEIGARLKERRSELEQAALTRVHAIADPVEAADPEYAEGLRRAVKAALDYGFAALEQFESLGLAYTRIKGTLTNCGEASGTSAYTGTTLIRGFG